MSKKYIWVRDSLYQHELDNWLLMIDTQQLSNDAKIVWMVLKKMQAADMSSMTDSRSWLKISGMKFARVKECLVELERFGLVELYHEAQCAVANRTTFTAYLLNHYLMQNRYPTRPCPHNEDSFPNPHLPDNVLRNSPVAQTMKDFLEQAQGKDNDQIKAVLPG